MDKDFFQKTLQSKKYVDTFAKTLKLYKNLSIDRTTNYFKMTGALKKIEIGHTQAESNFSSMHFDDWLRQEKARLEEIQTSLIYDFGRVLAEHLSKSGFRLEGNFPEFKVKMFLLEADVQKTKCKLWYGNKEEFLCATPFDPVSAQKAIILAYNRIAKHDFNGPAFLQRLYKAYEGVIKKQRKQLGDNVSIIETLVELNFLRQDRQFLADPRKNTFQEYPRECFSFDIYRLKQRQIDDFALNLGIATREQNRSRESYLWIPSEESLQGNVYSQLSFRRVN